MRNRLGDPQAAVPKIVELNFETLEADGSANKAGGFTCHSSQQFIGKKAHRS